MTRHWSLFGVVFGCGLNVFSVKFAKGIRKKMIKINFGKIAFLLCNFVFLVSGISLVFLGCVVLNDSPRILLSRLFLEPGLLAQPLLYYVALALIAAGLVICLIAMLGCWASCDPESTLLMGFYMFLLILLLLAESSLGSVAALCPQVIGVTSDRDQMVASLMNNYGVPGRSQYTAAVDLAQTLLECCGMLSGSDYDGSKWWKREQETRHDLRVPHSCCFLSNLDEENSFLNPRPVNSSLCQAKTNSRYQHGRHVKGCIDKLNAWFKEHVTIFLIIGLALVVIQLAVLLCALLVCLRKRNRPIQTPPSSSSTQSTNGRDAAKKHKRSEKNLTPRPERKTGTVAVQVREPEENGFVLGSLTQLDGDLRKNSLKIVDYLPKKLNSNVCNVTNQHLEDIVRRVDSPSLVPLVLRNEHFEKVDEYKSKRGATLSGRESAVVAKYITRNTGEGPNVYFTPRYDTLPRNAGFYPNETTDEYKLKDDLKAYFCKVDKYGLDNGTYDSYQDT